MTLTIEIDGPLAFILQSTAASRHQTASQLAKQLLADALGEQDEQWASLNRRRIELIQKSNRQVISAEESTELQRLQDAADQRLEQGDLQLLEQLNRFRNDVEKLPLSGSPTP